MRTTIVAALLIFSSVSAYSQGIVGASVGVSAGSCQKDEEISATQRGELDAFAMKVVGAALAKDTASTYAAMTKEVKSKLSLDKFTSGFLPIVQQMGPFEDPHVVHTYFIQSVGTGPDTRVVCGPLENNGWVSLAARLGLGQAHVLIEAKTRNNDWALTLWLLPEDNGWRVQYFNMAVASIVGMTPDVLLAKARQERDSGHLFNAAMLYAGVQATIDRGPAFELGIGQSFRDDLGKFKTPLEMSGNPPFDWKMGGAEYRVGAVQVGGIGKQLGIMFLLPHDTWTNNEDADKANRDFILAFIKSHPDYTRVFAFLVARAYKPDNSGGFATVYENGKGFD
jgi:hypothetical protein